MESLYFLIPLSMVVVGLGVWLFFWAVNNGQYDDLDGEAERILFDNLDDAKKGVNQLSSCHLKSELKAKSETTPEPAWKSVNSDND